RLAPGSTPDVRHHSENHPFPDGDYIQNVEAGDNFPSLPTLARLRAVLRCDWNELFAGCEKV
ncbi:MAG: hypothetical protein HS122_04520, partial [Opitutaceae bacterium]|nr:hypothetical protein [Opitutaceae bacterium]